MASQTSPRALQKHGPPMLHLKAELYLMNTINSRLNESNEFDFPLFLKKYQLKRRSEPFLMIMSSRSNYQLHVYLFKFVLNDIVCYFGFA